MLKVSINNSRVVGEKLATTKVTTSCSKSKTSRTADAVTSLSITSLVFSNCFRLLEEVQVIDSKVTKVTKSIFMAEYQRKQTIVIALSKRSVACLYLPELFFPFGGVEHLLLLTD